MLVQTLKIDSQNIISLCESFLQVRRSSGTMKTHSCQKTEVSLTLLTFSQRLIPKIPEMMDGNPKCRSAIINCEELQDKTSILVIVSVHYSLKLENWNVRVEILKDLSLHMTANTIFSNLCKHTDWVCKQGPRLS